MGDPEIAAKPTVEFREIGLSLGRLVFRGETSKEGEMGINESHAEK